MHHRGNEPRRCAQLGPLDRLQVGRRIEPLVEQESARRASTLSGDRDRVGGGHDALERVVRVRDHRDVVA